MDVIVWWFSLSVLAGFIAGSKGRSSFGFFVLSMILSPLIGLIAAIGFPSIEKDTSKPTPGSHIKCPDCAELVLKEAKVCKHCKRQLIPQ